MSTSNNMGVLKELVSKGELHHATYRNQGTLWEGLWFYRRKHGVGSFRGYEVAGAILANDPDLDDAYELVRGTGISIGSYGNG